MKFFCVSDVHSYFPALIKSLNDAGYDKNNTQHIFVCCGDLMDRGDYARKCLQFVNDIPSDRKILIRGNHEDLLENCIERKEFKSHDYHNGTAQTVCDIGDYGLTTYNLDDAFDRVKNDNDWNTYKNSLVDFYETDKYVFVHGWIPSDRDDTNPYHAKDIKYTFNKDWRHGDWNMARWVNGMDAWSQGIKVPGKTVVCGHWHTSWGHSKLHGDGVEFPNKRSTNPEHRVANFDPFVDEGIIAIDACTAYSHKVNCVVLEDDI